MEEEIWKPIEGYDGYEISSRGRVKSLPKPHIRYNSVRILRQNVDHNGYRSVQLSKDGVSYRWKIHHLVATAFIRKRKEGEEVDHINGNRADNRVENLRWLSHARNMKRVMTRNSMSRAKDFKKKSVMCVETGEVFESAYDASKKTGLSRSGIRVACEKYPRPLCGKHFKYVGE